MTTRRDGSRAPSSSSVRRSALEAGGYAVSVTRRVGQKRICMRVKPPDGRIEISAPAQVDDDAIRQFVRAHAAWIDEKRSLAASRVSRPASEDELARWKAAVRARVPVLIRRWSPVMGVSVSRVVYRNMVSRWGSCNPATGRICINVQLAAHPDACLEYVVVHELCHLLEAGHGPRFKALMDGFLPDWRDRAALLRGGIRR